MLLMLIYSLICRSSHLEVLCKKGVLKYFAKFTGKHLCQSLFFNKVVGLRPATLLRKTLAQMFSCEFCKVFKNTFFLQNTYDDCFWIWKRLEIYTAWVVSKVKFNSSFSSVQNIWEVNDILDESFYCLLITLINVL